jgi:hypothetical protein
LFIIVMFRNSYDMAHGAGALAMSGLVPEPSSMLMLAAGGVAGLGLWRRTRIQSDKV